MRLITWNCKGAYRRKHGFISALNPDLVIVPECERMSGIDQELGAPVLRSFLWFGSEPKKGLGVLSYGDYTVEVHPAYVERHKWIVPLNVTGATSFLLFAVWSIPVPSTGSYVQPVLDAFDEYQGLMDQRNVV